MEGVSPVTRIVLRGGRVIDPSTGRDEIADVAVGPMEAAAGGFTTVCAMPNAKPVNDNRAITEMTVAKGKSHGLVNLHPIGAITRGLAGCEFAEMADLRDALRAATTDGAGRKALMRDRKARRKAPVTAGRPVFVLDFDGDILAGAVASLREEVTAILQAAGRTCGSPACHAPTRPPPRGQAVQPQ